MSRLPAVKVIAPKASRDTNSPVWPSSAYCMLVSIAIVTAVTARRRPAPAAR
jgi:hypothetical protein